MKIKVIKTEIDDVLIFEPEKFIDKRGCLIESFNQEFYSKYLPEIKPSIKGHSNWSNMLKSEKIVGNHLRFFCKVLTDEKMKCKPMRYPKYKSYMVNKYLLPV